MATGPTSPQDAIGDDSDAALRTAALEEAEGIAPQIEPGTLEMPRVLRALRNPGLSPAAPEIDPQSGLQRLLGQGREQLAGL